MCERGDGEEEGRREEDCKRATAKPHCSTKRRNKMPENGYPDHITFYRRWDYTFIYAFINHFVQSNF